MNDAIKDLLFQTVIPFVLQQIFKVVPFLGLPIVSSIVSMVVGWAGKWIFNELSKMMDFSKIQWQVDEQNQKYQEAVAALRLVQEKENASPYEREFAKQEFKNTLRDLIRLNA